MSSVASARATLGTTVPTVVVPLAAFLAGFGPVAMLGFSGGGYAVATVASYGVVLWWLLLVGILTGALPRPRPSKAGWAVLGAVGLWAAWGGVSLGWSASPERGLTEVVRLVAYGGSLTLGLVVVRAGQARVLMGGVLTGLVAIVGAGVLSRLQPDLFAGSSDIATWLGERRRLSWPLDYWNGVGAAAAMALSLGLVVAARARSVVGSALAAAGLPVVALGLVLTLSRGGIAAAAVGVVVAVVAVAPRPVVLRTLLAPALGAASLIAATLDSAALREAVGGAAQTDAGRRLLPLVVLVTVGVALVQAGWRTADVAHWTPRIPRTSRRVGVKACAAAVLVLVVAALAAGTPSRVGDAWSDFKDPDTTGIQARSGSVDRLAVANGSGRYEEWSGAVRALRENPLGGIGLGSWESWWSPRREFSPPVRNAHSEPLEIAAELGVPGLALLAVVLLTPLFVAARRARSLRTGERVALPALAAFLVALCVDWSWQLSALPVAAALLAATLVGRATPETSEADRAAPRRGGPHAMAAGVGTAVVAVAAIGVLAVALIAPHGVDRSRAAAATGALGRAADEAATTAQSAPFSLQAATQRALVAERAGDLTAAAATAREATTIEPRNWRPWMLLARIEARRGRPQAAVDAYRQARMLNPRSRLLNP